MADTKTQVTRPLGWWVIVRFDSSSAVVSKPRGTCWRATEREAWDTASDFSRFMAGEGEAIVARETVTFRYEETETTGVVDVG